jgi:hypothetical protein
VGGYKFATSRCKLLVKSSCFAHDIFCNGNHVLYVHCKHCFSNGNSHYITSHSDILELEEKTRTKQVGQVPSGKNYPLEFKSQLSYFSGFILGFNKYLFSIVDDVLVDSEVPTMILSNLKMSICVCSDVSRIFA